MKRLVLCCDGTWSSPWQRSPTNVVRFYNALAERGPDGAHQVASYRKGVGTTPFERLRGGIFGYGLSREVRNAYAWVVEQFEPGDEIWALGFSRGAFTARSTVGLIRKAGVLRRDEAGRVDEAYDLYRRSDVRPSDPAPTAFREAHSHETRIRFVGVWDTVGALGIPVSRVPLLRRINQKWAFHDTQLSSHVDAAYHAVAIDERREPFRPTLWEARATEAPDQVVEQVWFAGTHSDVGGGTKDDVLADLTLWWMQQRALAEGLGLRDDAQARDPRWTTGPIHESRTGVFRLSKKLERPIGVVDPEHERASSTAVERLDLDASYRPPELERYLARGGAVQQL